MGHKKTINIFVYLVLLTLFSTSAYALCLTDGDCLSDGWYCTSSYNAEWRNYYCSYFSCTYASSNQYDCSNDYCYNSDTRYYNGYCNSNIANRCSYYSQTCTLGCSGGECNSCTDDGGSCSSPGSSTMECCSTSCADDGICGVPECYSDSNCGDDGWTGNDYCYNNDVYQDYDEGDCRYPGDHDAYCRQIADPRKVEECGALGCSGGECNSCTNDGGSCSAPGTSTIECCSGTCADDSVCGEPDCYSDSNCADDGWTGSNYCSDNDVYGNYEVGDCRYPGDHDAYCRQLSEARKVEECGALGCSGGSCITCKADGQSCSAPGTSTIECCSSACADDSICGVPACYSDSNCPADNWIGSPYCQTNDVWQGVEQYSCSNPGDHDAECYGSSTTAKKEECGDYGCTNGACNTCKADGIACSAPGTSTTECCSTACADDSICGVPECYSDSNCPDGDWTGATYCTSNDVYQDYNVGDCGNAGDSDAYCTFNAESRKKEECGALGCSGGSCITCKADGVACSAPGTSTIECCSGTCAADGVCGVPDCYSDSNCPDDNWLNDPYCQSGDVWQGVEQYTCSNPGDHDAECYGSSTTAEKEDCNNYGCTNGTCNTCKADGISCSAPGTSTTECCSLACAFDSICGDPECYDDGGCPDDNWLNDPYCQDGNVWQGVEQYECSNPGNHDAECYGSSTTAEKEDCNNYGCTNGTCNPCKADGIACSAPGTSTTECCSTSCADDGYCGVPGCYNDGNCPDDNWLNDPYCQDGDVWQGVEQYVCYSAGNHNAECQGTSTVVEKENCVSGCINGSCTQCKSDGESCSSPGTSTTECCSDFCANDGYCGVPICYTNDNCTDSWAEDEYCENGKVWDTYIQNSCFNMGNHNAYCYANNYTQVKEYCQFGCLSGECTTTDCDFPDGSSWHCDCDSDPDCPSGYFCNQVSGPDNCAQINYNDECSNHNDYFCEDGWVIKCEDGGTNWYKLYKESCTGKYEYCDPTVVDGTASCSKYPNHMDVWIDYADTGVVVNKQEGDLLKVHVFSEQDITVDVFYDSEVFEGTCPLGDWSITEGDNVCELTVKPLFDLGKEKIFIDDKFAIVKTVFSPELIVLTDSQQLFNRYPHESGGVEAVLKQAYANAEDDGVVYDMGWYDLGESNPFNTFSSYNEKITYSSMTDNSYSTAVSGFLKERCYSCKYVMVVGDDFVIPHYRRDIPTLTWDWFSLEEGSEDIYTDIPYTNKEVLQFSNYYEMFRNHDKYEGKGVMFILPNVMTSEQELQVKRLMDAFDDKGYKPNFYNKSGSDTYCIDESWFRDVNGKSLVIIGTEENNNAFKCMPFVSGDINRDAFFMQPNVWDNEEYAIVINTDNADVIGFFAYLVESGDIVKLKGESAYVFNVGVEIASYVALGAAVTVMVAGTGGTAAPAALILVAAVLDTVADAGDVVDSCYVNEEGITWCGAAITFAAVPLVSSRVGKNALRALDDSNLNQLIKNAFGGSEELFEKYFKKTRKIFGNEAFEKVIRTADDNVHVAKGADEVTNLLGGTPDNALKKFDELIDANPNYKVRLLKQYGEAAQEFAEKGWKRLDIEKGKRVFRGTSVDHFPGGSDDMRRIMKGEGIEATNIGNRDLKKHLFGSDFSGGYTDGSAFLATSKDVDIAMKRYATSGGTKEGWVFVINPRSGTAIDSVNMLDDMAMDPVTRQLLKVDQEVSIIGKINPEDIEYAFKVDKFGDSIPGTKIRNIWTYAEEVSP